MNPLIIKEVFEQKFASKPEFIVRAPGRINLIGEHTDYNDGFVMPAAIDKSIFLALNKRNDNKFAFYALDLDDFLIIDPTFEFQKKHSWANYLLGVIDEARKEGYHIGGLNLAFGSDIPLGAGLSSSAALESGMLFIINELYELNIAQMEIVRLAQKGENNFVGMKCGIMDMFASVMGKKNFFVRLDCRNLSYEYFPFESEEYSLVLCDSCVKHALVDSEYNTRRAECEEGVAILKKQNAEIASLRDVSKATLFENKENLRPIVFQRCKYVIEEIERVEAACFALQNNDFESLGKLMFETHDGLNLDYEVSCEELNFMVDFAKNNSAVLGARLMGGGFGGCTINLVKKADIQLFTNSLQVEYGNKFGKKMKIYPVNICDGATLCTLEK